MFDQRHPAVVPRDDIIIPLVEANLPAVTPQPAEKDRILLIDGQVPIPE